jgi:hypothetical protein
VVFDGLMNLPSEKGASHDSRTAPKGCYKKFVVLVLYMQVTLLTPGQSGIYSGGTRFESANRKLDVRRLL